jgi:YVTN family beta-propeller protein
VCSVSGDPHPDNRLFVANQIEQSVLLVDTTSKQVLATVGVDINGHEVAVSPDGVPVIRATKVDPQMVLRSE